MSSHHANTVRIGAFVVGGLALVVAAVLATAGSSLFASKEHVVMHFAGSIYGLQVGAPVVFRGVHVGNVTAIGLVYDGTRGEFTIPVKADLDEDVVRQQLPDGKPGRVSMAVTSLIAKGLSAQLSMQSLLTGQLYVDLDLRPNQKRASSLHDPRLIEIPTSVTAIQNIKAQLDGMDFRRVLDDVSAIAGSVRQLATGPALPAALDDLRVLSANLRRLSARLDRQADPLAQSAQRTLADARRLMGGLQGSNEQLRDTLGRFSNTADQASALLAADSPVVQQVQRAAAELAQTAAALREQAGAESPLSQNLERTLQEVSRASRAVGQLADLLEQQPQSLLRGRAPAARPPAESPP